MEPIIAITQLYKTYQSGFSALKDVNLTINQGEIFALLGPNGAGKTTLISIICGLVSASSGEVLADSLDINKHYRETRRRIGLVPQEIALNIFDTVWHTVRFSRGLFGLAPDDGYLEQLLKDLSLWDKRHSKIIALSGGMKRRVLIAKALSHQPKILFLDEPTAGVDVELRREMWGMIRRLREQGVTIILTTHYIEEAEDMADRIGVINNGQIILVEDKNTLMQQLGRKTLSVFFDTPITTLPMALKNPNITLTDQGKHLTYTYNTADNEASVAKVLSALAEAGISYRDLQTEQSSLEEIFVNLVEGQA